MSKVSFAQRGMWVTERLVGAGTAYHVPLAVRFGAGLDGGALLKACAAVVDRHPVLAMTVREVDGELELVPGEPVAIGGQEEPFDLDRGPLARFSLDGRTLGFVAHHLVFDGHSKDVLVRDLAALYNGESLPALEPAQDEDFAALLPEAKAYWAERWREPGETVVHGSPLRVRRAGDALVSELRADPRVPGLTRFETLIAALHVLLAGYGTADVVTAIDLSTRTRDDEQRIGVFVNELPIGSSPAPEQTFAGFGAQVRERLREVYRFRAVPLAAAVPNLRPHAALTPVSVSYRARTGPDPVFDGVEAEVDWTVFNGGVRGSVHLQCVDGLDGLLVSVRHLPEVDGARLAAELGELLAAVTADPDALLSDLVAFEEVVQEVSAPEARTKAIEAPIEQVREIWQEVLGVSPILDDDDIFDLGGHSLTITQIIARMEKRLGLKVELDDFFDHPTIAGVMGTASHD